MKLKLLLSSIFKHLDVYFFTVDHNFRKIIIFTGSFILEVSTVDRWCDIKKSKKLFFYIRKFEDIKNIYDFANDVNAVGKENISNVIKSILKYEKEIYYLLIKENTEYFDNTFSKISTNKKLLLILKWWGMEETIEKSFISYCNNSKLNLTVLYKFWKWYWWQQLNQDGFFIELKANNPNVKFLYKEDLNDNYIDSIIDENTEVFNFQYDYKWKNKNLSMLVLSSVTDFWIDCLMYKNIFSCYNSKSIWYSSDKFFNTENTNVYKIFNPQNIDLLRNYCVLKNPNDFILSWWMSWCRDFSVLNSLEWKYRWILISDEICEIKNFLSMYRWIQSHYWFFWAYAMSSFGVFCHTDEYNDDDRSKMIATAICSWKPVVVPYNDWLIVKDILDNKLGVSYINWDMNDLVNKVKFFAENKSNILEYSKRCLKYSEEKMDINKFINTIFEKTFNK